LKVELIKKNNRACAERLAFRIHHHAMPFVKDDGLVIWMPNATANVDGCIKTDAYRTRRLERAVRFELTIIGFADQCLWPLGYARNIGAEREALTLETNLENSGT
jgi:hypothetical protein